MVALAAIHMNASCLLNLWTTMKGTDDKVSKSNCVQKGKMPQLICKKESYTRFCLKAAKASPEHGSFGRFEVAPKNFQLAMGLTHQWQSLLGCAGCTC